MDFRIEIAVKGKWSDARAQAVLRSIKSFTSSDAVKGLRTRDVFTVCAAGRPRHLQPGHLRATHHPPQVRAPQAAHLSCTRHHRPPVPACKSTHGRTQFLFTVVEYIVTDVKHIFTDVIYIDNVGE